MTDDVDRGGVTPGGAFDDDRLLAFAMELGEDVELEAALAADDALRRRFEGVRAEVDAVGAQVSAAVPAPGEQYTDLGDARWAGLREFFEPARPTRRRASRWLRVLAPAAVLVVALAVGLAVISSREGGSGSVSRMAASGVAKSSAEDGGQLAAPVRAAPPVLALTDQAKKFAVVVVARARQARGAFQDFAVVRTLRGSVPTLLHLRVAGQPADPGKLQVILLRPSDGAIPPAAGVAANPSPLLTLSPAPGVSPSATAVTGPGLSSSASAAPQPSPAAAEPAPGGALPALTEAPRSFGYAGELALAQELPAGVSAASLVLP